MNLARHIGPLGYRLEYHMHMDNPMLPDIKTRFPLAYSMAAGTSQVLERHFGSQPLMKSSATSPWHLPWPSSSKPTSRVANAS